MQDLNVILIQTLIHWEDPEANRTMFDQICAGIVEPVDLIVLPEMFNTGFTMNADSCSEPINGPTVQWMKEKARSLQCVVTGSILTEEKGRYYNRMYWVSPNGDFEYYDKRHLFRMGNEHKTMTQGNIQKIVDLKGWKVCLQVCYDLRFPVWSMNRFHEGDYAYDLLIYVANWPAVRRNAYLSLLPARAIENQAYVLWVNRVGPDGGGVDHSGDTMAIDPYGNLIKQAIGSNTELVNFKIKWQTLKDFRSKFMVGLDWDELDIH